MNFLVISDAPIIKQKDKYFAYAPYVNEMNIWMKYCETTIISPTKYHKPLLIKNFNREPIVKSIPALVFNSFGKSLKSIISMPYIFFMLFFQIYKTDHLHLRCPGNIGLLGSLVQILFPNKKKTVKYAGNWDPNSKQPLSYRIQKWILSNTFLTKNCKVLVYGEWKNQSKNIVPFFTASYRATEIEVISDKDISKLIRFIYVGAFSEGKQPMLSVKTIEKLLTTNYNIQLDMYGNGDEFEKVKNYIKEKSLGEYIYLHGNQSKDIVKEAFKKAHFLIFISKSEGWPKVVAEAMFWKCLPISSKVSCVEFMLGYGNRGILVDDKTDENLLSKIVINILENNNYHKKVNLAQNWSHNFTLDKFESEIKKLLI
ncbi:glycosyltransferase [Polaribacter aquimarinus]|uniref:Glycosyl transferase n=2 Tax=Polaribacter TaxID=52959 RepID=A0A2U2J7H0_9FLAO|nr:glycosyltransferase [Polaribacter aquimarinus]PWG04286.1 glycosyl transferase [Polaribacter aquimarinus]